MVISAENSKHGRGRGEARGEAAGRVRGEARGRVQGRTEGEAYALLRLLEKRFGTVSSRLRRRIGDSGFDLHRGLVRPGIDTHDLEFGGSNRARLRNHLRPVVTPALNRTCRRDSSIGGRAGCCASADGDPGG